MHLRGICRLLPAAGPDTSVSKAAETWGKDIQVREENYVQFLLPDGPAVTCMCRYMRFCRGLRRTVADDYAVPDSGCIPALHFPETSNFKKLLLVFNVYFVSLRPGNFAERDSGSVGSIFMI